MFEVISDLSHAFLIQIEASNIVTSVKVFPSYRGTSGVMSRPAGPGVEVFESPVLRRRRTGEELDMYTNLE
jgi:hypothetical protein